MRQLICLLMVMLPGSLKRLVATRLLGWEIHPTAHLGRSLVIVDHLVMGPQASIGPGNTIRHLSELRMGEGATISSRNWIVGVPKAAPVYPKHPHRDPSLVMDDFALITVGHNIDVTDRVTLGKQAAVAGFGSQILTHNLNLVTDLFQPGKVTIGDYGVLMSGCTMQNNTAIPNRSVVSAGSVVVTKLKDELTLYRGNPAEAVRTLPETLKFFHRQGRQQQVEEQMAEWAGGA